MLPSLSFRNNWLLLGLAAAFANAGVAMSTTVTRSTLIRIFSLSVLGKLRGKYRDDWHDHQTLSQRQSEHKGGWRGDLFEVEFEKAPLDKLGIHLDDADEGLWETYRKRHLIWTVGNKGLVSGSHEFTATGCAFPTPF